MSRPNPPVNERLVLQRVLLFQVVVVLAFVALTVQLWRIQILGGRDYQALAKENSVRLETIDAPRGIIYDRNGHILVRNRPSFRATLLPARIGGEIWQTWGNAEWEQTALALRRIAQALHTPLLIDEATTAGALHEAFAQATGTLRTEEIDKLCQQGQLFRCFSEALITAPFRPVTLRQDLPRDVAFTIMENSINLPGLTVEPVSQREYVDGALFSHLVGFQLPITQGLLDSQTRFTNNPYLPTDRVGTAGIEMGFEEELRGIKGLRLVEKNVLGEPLRVTREDPPIPGNNLFLTVDRGLQQAVTEALQAGLDSVGSKEGVAIVMNPNTGEVLAMVSLPSYDNNLFAGDIDPDVNKELSEDPKKPMFNRAISGTFPPGSIFKVIPAAGALADGVITRDTVINDPGSIFLPNQFAPDDPSLAQEFVCWLETGHGDETVVDALAHSCDVFFYEVGGGYLDQFKGLGIDRLASWASAFGLGELTGIRLPGEVAGHVPTPRWKRLTWQQLWVTGDTYNMSIGQGDVLVTPLQILNATTAVANGGTIYEPQLVYQVQDVSGQVVQSFEPRPLRKVDVAPEHLAVVREGMRGAIAWEDGTARLPFDGAPVSVAGKTGTSEYCERLEVVEEGKLPCKLDPEGHMLTHAWFTAFAPYENPEIAVVVFVHGNGESVIQGSEIAAPIARRIIDYYFSRPPDAAALPADPAGAGETAE